MYLLSFFKCKCKVVSPILRFETVPVKTVWIEDMNQGTECQAIVPAGGEIGHGNLKSYRSNLVVNIDPIRRLKGKSRNKKCPQGYCYFAHKTHNNLINVVWHFKMSWADL